MVDKPHWEVDRRIPVAIIITLIGGMISGAYYFGGIASSHELKINSNERRIANLEGAIAEVRELSRDITEIKTHLPYIRDGISELKRKGDENTADINNVAKFLQDKIEWQEDNK